MTWPKRYGGGERSMLERYVVTEELLAAGAPVGAHWIADRQSAPLLLRYGTEEQRLAFLPGIARGEIFFCIGMRDPADHQPRRRARLQRDRARPRVRAGGPAGRRGGRRQGLTNWDLRVIYNL
jgi:alkylation response protein AidB-like acyl-CoA dehydrogenase